MKHLGTNFLNLSCNHFLCNRYGTFLLIGDIYLVMKGHFLLLCIDLECMTVYLHSFMVWCLYIGSVLSLFFNYPTSLNASYVQSQYNTIDLRSLTYYSRESLMVALVALWALFIQQWGFTEAKNTSAEPLVFTWIWNWQFILQCFQVFTETVA